MLFMGGFNVRYVPAEATLSSCQRLCVVLNVTGRSPTGTGVFKCAQSLAVRDGLNMITKEIPKLKWFKFYPVVIHSQACSLRCIGSPIFCQQL